MRFSAGEVVMDDDISQGDTSAEFCGYLWAYKVFCDMVGYNGKVDTDDYINLYPVYNVEIKEFRVDASMYVNGKYSYKEVPLNDEEKDFIFKKFVEQYFGNKEEFDSYVKEIKEELREKSKNNRLKRDKNNNYSNRLNFPLKEA